MKSGPTLADATSKPRRRSAAISPVATVVLPTPEWVPAITTRAVTVLSDLWVPAPDDRTQRSIFDALLGPDALLVGVLDLAHLGDGVGQGDDLLGRIPAGDDDVGLGRPPGQPGDDLVDRNPAVLHRVGELVQDQQVVVARGQLVAGHLPGVPALGRRLVQIGGLPGEAVAQGVPLDAEVVGQLALARLPLAALAELDHADPPAASPAPAHHPEGGRRLALPVAGGP